ncbi:MAG: DUF5808 domain-containing protein [Actinomycetota bacterium]
MKRRRSRLGSLLKVASWVLTIGAVAQEVNKPSAERTWHGTVAGFVPYDFRFPTPERMKSSWWNPDDERVLTPQVFGVGWAVNVGRVVRLLKG